MLVKNILLDARGKKSVTTSSMSISKYFTPNAYCTLQFNLTGIHVGGFPRSTVLFLDMSHKDSQCIELVD